MKQTQGERLAFRLRQFPHTYAEMNALGISVCPQKRVSEWLELAANDGYRLDKGKRMVSVNHELVYLTTWRVVKK